MPFLQPGCGRRIATSVKANPKLQPPKNSHVRRTRCFRGRGASQGRRSPERAGKAQTVPHVQEIQPRSRPGEAQQLPDPRGERRGVGESAPQRAAPGRASRRGGRAGRQPQPQPGFARVPPRRHPDLAGARDRRADDARRRPRGARLLPQARAHLRGNPLLPRPRRRGARLRLPGDRARGPRLPALREEQLSRLPRGRVRHPAADPPPRASSTSRTSPPPFRRAG